MEMIQPLKTGNLVRGPLRIITNLFANGGNNLNLEEDVDVTNLLQPHPLRPRCPP